MSAKVDGLDVHKSKQAWAGDMLTFQFVSRIQYVLYGSL